MSLESYAAARGWRLSSALHHRGWRRLAHVVKVGNYFLFRALLPPQARLGEHLRMKHYALGVVVHPNTRIGQRVTIYHHVTIAAEARIGGPNEVVIEDDVVIGVGAKIIPPSETGLRIGRGSHVGAGAVVTRDVPANSVAIGVPAKCRPKVPQEFAEAP